MKKAIVIGSVGNETHEANVRGYFLTQSPGWQCDIAEIGSGTPAGNIVTYQTDVAGCVSYAIANGYSIIIRSYTGLWQSKLEWDLAYAAGIFIVHAHGSNSNVELSEPPYIGSAVACGAGATENICSHGPGIEIWDQPIGGLVESWGTAIVAGKFANILDALNHPIQYLRYLAQLTASNNGIWDSVNGFGKIDVAAAIAYVVPRRERMIKNILLAA